MSTTPVFDKVTFLRAQRLESVCTTLAHRLRHKLSECTSIVRPPASLIQMLAVDLTHANSRHWRWFGTTSFRDIYREYLITEFNIESNFANAAMHESSSLCGTLSFQESADNNFLDYLIALTLTTRDIDYLIRDFGIGAMIYRKILDFAERMFSKENNGPTTFATTLDLQIRRSLLRLASLVDADSEAISIELLRYRSLELSQSQDGGLDRNQCRHILHLLVELAKQGQQTRKAVESVWTESTKTENATIIPTLERLDLLFRVDRARNLDHDRFALTENGERFAAPAFITRELEKSVPSADWFTKLSATFQAEAARQVHSLHASVLIDVLSHSIDNISPKGAIAAFERVSKQSKIEKSAAFLELILRKSTNPWIRAALCSKAGSLQCVRLDRYIKMLAQHDPSAMVRDAALSSSLVKSA
jgi:hypothetical protein